jgi:hypothetical protein
LWRDRCPPETVPNVINPRAATAREGRGSAGLHRALGEAHTVCFGRTGPLYKQHLRPDHLYHLPVRPRNRTASGRIMRSSHGGCRGQARAERGAAARPPARRQGRRRGGGGGAGRAARRVHAAAPAPAARGARGRRAGSAAAPPVTSEGAGRRAVRGRGGAAASRAV